jgi:hypothetical protein
VGNRANSGSEGAGSNRAQEGRGAPPGGRKASRQDRAVVSRPATGALPFASLTMNSPVASTTVQGVGKPANVRAGSISALLSINCTHEDVGA